MNWKGLLALIRARLDDNVVPPRWDDDTLLEYANDAIRQVVIRKRLLLDRTTAEVCSYAVEADTANITLHEAVLAVRSARWSGSTEPLALTTLKRLDRLVPDWPSRDSGCPTHLVLDADTGGAMLFPAPSAAGTLSIACWRAPYGDELLEGEEDIPCIDPLFHRDLIDWVEHLAYLNPDGETEDAARSARAENRFTAKIGPLPDAHAMKLWALGRGRGQQAQFT